MTHFRSRSFRRHQSTSRSRRRAQLWNWLHNPVGSGPSLTPVKEHHKYPESGNAPPGWDNPNKQELIERIELKEMKREAE